MPIEAALQSVAIDRANQVEILNWIFLQLSSYSALAWVTFTAITAVSAYLLRSPGVLLGHPLVAIAVAVLDVQWVQSEMSKPEWDGTPDQDTVFLIGVLIRSVLINTLLLPVGLIAVRLSGRKRDANLTYEVVVK